MSKRARSAECPLCGAPASTEHRPFCGQGCRDRDLLNWLGEAYRVPGPQTHANDGGDAENGLDSE